MSFGFAIGDFIAVGDKAWHLYQKCKSAREDYGTLVDHVGILHSVLEDVKNFVSGGEVPELQNERSSLVAARQNCLATLEELDAFLTRHAGLVDESRKRKFELAKFVTKDIKSLKAKLDHSTKLLQLSLQSLQMYSVHEIRRELKEILREYRSGAREPTVVSQAIFANKQAEAKSMNAELTQQIHADLEDKDIHPISISLNDSFIHQWLERTLADGGLEESDDTFEETNRPEFERISDVAQSVILSTGTQDVVPPERAVGDVPTTHDIHGEDTEEIIRSPPDYLDETRTLGIDDVSRPPSRTESISSHRSKPDDWRPYDTPNPAWVRDMLLPLFNRDPFLNLAEADLDLRIKRAFHQQDYDRKGAIADHKVLRLCEDLVKTLNLPAILDNLRTTVYSVDSDGNGQFDEAEYMTLMKILISTVMDRKKDILLTILRDYGHEAAEAAQRQRASSGADYLLWGWHRTPRGFEHPYQDSIANCYQDTAPTLPALSFTLIAGDARIAVERIDDFEEQWLRIVPKESQRREDFKAPLEVARELAYRFKALENPQDRRSMSDLDGMIYCSRILRAGGNPKEKKHFDIAELHKTCSYAFQIIGLIQGFVLILEKISRELGSHEEAHYYVKLNEKLRSHQVAQLAKHLTLQAEDWNKHVTQKVESYRHAHSPTLLISLWSRCKVLASRYHTRLTHAQHEARSRLLEWAVLLEKVEISDWKISRGRRLLDMNKRVWVKIHISDSGLGGRLAVTALFLKRAESLHWELPYCRRLLSLESSVVIHIGYEGEDKPQLTSSRFQLENLESPCPGKYQLDFWKRTLTYDDGPNKKERDRYTFEHRQECTIRLTVRFDNEQAKAEEYAKIKNVTWMDLLRVSGHKIPYELKDFDNPKWDRKKITRLPSGWEECVSLSGQTYYVDHNTRTTSWVLPEPTQHL